MINNYAEERKNTSIDRVALAILMAIILWGGSKLLSIEHLSLVKGIVVNIFLMLSVEFSFEFKDGVLKVRSNGKFYDLDGFLKFITWPFAKILALFGLKNQPIWGYLVGGLYIYFMIFKNFQIVDGVFHLITMYTLYKNRKENK